MIVKRNLIILGLGTAIVAALGLLIAWLPNPSGEAAAGGDTWTCSMHPQIRLPNPGQCPICGMKLIPISKLPNAKDELEKRAGLETETIHRHELFKEIRTVGKIDYSERQVELITARISGRVDRLYVDFTGIEVKENDHLVDIYSPELYSAQAELIRTLEAYETRRTGIERSVDRFAETNLLAVREKLRLFGLLPEQIAEIEKSRKERTHVTIYAPLFGTVIEKNVRRGQYVKEGDQLYRIANLDPIWLYLNIYEYDLAWVRFGQQVEVTLEAFAGETIRGTVTFIDPFLDDMTRTIRVRVNLKNSDRRLKPQMYATATIRVPLRSDGSPAATGLEGKYVCPMHPEVVKSEPGNCSICEMPLERVPELRTRLARLPSQSALSKSDLEQTDNAARKAAATSQDANLIVAEDVRESIVDDKSDETMVGATLRNSVDNMGLALPVSAVLDTGRRQIAYRLTKLGAYELVELTLGSRAQAVDEAGRTRDYYLVLNGLNDGDQVVVQSGFLLDSQRQIEGMPSLLYATGQSASMAGHAGHAGSSTNAGGHNPTPTPANPMPTEHKH